MLRGVLNKTKEQLKFVNISPVALVSEFSS